MGFNGINLALNCAAIELLTACDSAGIDIDPLRASALVPFLKRSVALRRPINWAYCGMPAPLAHRHYDTFEPPEAPERLLPDLLAITFFTDREDIAKLPLRSSRSSKRCGATCRGWVSTTAVLAGAWRSKSSRAPTLPLR
jgi:hypothetical protein